MKVPFFKQCVCLFSFFTLKMLLLFLSTFKREIFLQGPIHRLMKGFSMQFPISMFFFSFCLHAESFDEKYSNLQIAGLSCLGIGVTIFFLITFLCLLYCQRNRIGNYNLTITPKQDNRTFFAFNAWSCRAPKDQFRVITIMIFQESRFPESLNSFNPIDIK